MAGGANDPSTVSNLNVVESWNGSSWTEVAEINTGRAHMGSRAAGTQTAGLIFGGVNTYPGTNQLAVTESWNGSAWTEVNDLNTARDQLCGIGTQSSSLGI